MVEKIRDREDRGREWELANKEDAMKNLQDDNNRSGLLKKEGVYRCLKKPLELDKLLTVIAS